MKPRTKLQLNALFYLGLVTAALSIGRAATTTEKNLTEDTTCMTLPITLGQSYAYISTGNMISSYYFSGFESELGIIFACGPALRQFFSYRRRTHSVLPTRYIQHPNEDFEKMRFRINSRDIFWYREPPMNSNRVFDARRIFQSKTHPPEPSSRNPESTSNISSSILDVWERKLKNIFGTTKGEAMVSCAR